MLAPRFFRFALTLGLGVCLLWQNSGKSQPVDDAADVIVVGAGIGGLSVAWEAGRRGLHVTVVDMFSVFGGHAVMSEGGLALVGTPLQKANHVVDTPALAIGDFLEWGEDATVPWVEAYARGSNERVFGWLTSLGVKFSGLRKQAGNRAPRFHENPERGLGIVAPIYRDCLRYPNIRFVWNHQALSLLREENRVVGIRAKQLRSGRELDLRAGSVVIATGGYQSSMNLVKANWPKDLPFPENLLLGAGLNAVGSGLTLGQEAGAAVERMDHQWNYPWGMADPRFPGGKRGLNARVRESIWVNTKGQRFTSELMNARDGLKAVLRQNPSRYYVIFDSKGKASMSVAGTHWVEFSRIETQLIENPNITLKAETLTELASKAGLPKNTLEATVERYNSMVVAGDDIDFHRFGQNAPDARLTNDRMHAPPTRIEIPPFYAIPMGPLTRKSMGGLRVNLQGQVLKPDGRPIEGLYAVGEVTGFGGINGKAGLEGTFLGPSMFQGRAVGEHLSSQNAPIAPVDSAPPSQGTDGTQCQRCHNLSRLLASNRPGYQHFELVHGVVLERGLECVQCHAEQSPFRPDQHRIHPLAQSYTCARCHLGK